MPDGTTVAARMGILLAEADAIFKQLLPDLKSTASISDVQQWHDEYRDFVIRSFMGPREAGGD